MSLQLFETFLSPIIRQISACTY